MHVGGVNVCLGDGSVRFVSNSIHIQDLASIFITPRGRDHWLGFLIDPSFSGDC